MTSVQIKMRNIYTNNCVACLGVMKHLGKNIYLLNIYCGISL